MAQRDINVTAIVVMGTGTQSQIFNNSTLEYTVVGTKGDGTPVNVSGTKSLPTILADMTTAQRKAWFEHCMVLAARVAYLGDEV